MLRIKALASVICSLALAAGWGHAVAGPVIILDPQFVEIQRAGPWRIKGSALMPGMGCSGWIEDDRITLIAIFDTEDRIVLMAKQPGWTVGGEVITELSFDDAPPKKQTIRAGATMAGAPLDPDQLAAARKSKTLTWMLPGGRFTINIERFSEMMAAVEACEARRPAR